jgi:ubiquinone/menaquinone biosynthesis C-methylase UbiE
MTSFAPVLDRLSVLADPTRSRLLLLLERHELTVGELCTILQLPQSTVSRHLKLLADDGWVVTRADGTSRFYRLSPSLDAAAGRLWDVVEDEVARTPEVADDLQRADAVLSSRRARSREFFKSAAARWDALRDDLYGSRRDIAALLALLDDRWTVADLGCGTGRLTELLAPNVSRVVAVDASSEMLAEARERLRGRTNVELRSGDLEALPLADESVDAAIIALVLHYAAQPARVIAEAARVLRPGGKLLVLDMTPHGHDEYRTQMGHVWQGFPPEQVQGWMEAAGLEGLRIHVMPAEEDPRTLGLFVAVARRPENALFVAVARRPEKS